MVLVGTRDHQIIGRGVEEPAQGIPIMLQQNAAKTMEQDIATGEFRVQDGLREEGRTGSNPILIGAVSGE
jgi:hypothetical protein